MKKTLTLLFFWLLLVNLFALITLNRFNLNSDTAYEWIDPAQTAQRHSWNPIDLHARWDSFYYLDIASNGYHLVAGNTLSNVVFLPLYPFLISLLAAFGNLDLALAGWIWSILFLFGSAAILFKLVREFHPTIDPEQAIFYLLIFPTSFFLNAVYTESLFLFLSLLAFYWSLKGRFGLAGIFGLLASLTRITGVLLLIPIAWEYYRRHGRQGLLRLSILPLLLIPLGTLSFFAFHNFAFGDPFLFFKVESAWGRSFNFNADHFNFISYPAIINFIMDVMFSVFALVAAYQSFRQKWVSYGLYMLSTLLVAISTGTLMSIGRYILVLFPMYIGLAAVRNRHFEKIYTLGSILLLALNITLYVNWYWAG